MTIKDLGKCSVNAPYLRKGERGRVSEQVGAVVIQARERQGLAWL